MTPDTEGAAGSRGRAAAVIKAAARLRARRAAVRRKVIASLAIVVVSAAAIGGCTASRNGLGNHDNACFRVLPEALAAVHHRGHFAGERYLAPKALIVQLHHVVVPDALADASKVATCLVAFTGRFSVSDVNAGGRRRAVPAASPSSSYGNETSSFWPRSCWAASRRGSSSPTCSPASLSPGPRAAQAGVA